MIDWIVKNKEWLFSGVGVVIVIAIISQVIILIKKKLFKPESKTTVEVQSPSLLNKTQVQDRSYEAQESQSESNSRWLDHRMLSPEQILKIIKETPPFQREDVIKHHIGIAVDWDVTFFSAKKENDDMVRVVLSDPKIAGIISCSIKLSEYREIALIKEGTKLRVTGTIAGIDDPCFTLSDVNLYSR